ncbi:MAG: carbamate kinase [Bacillota bacterium]
MPKADRRLIVIALGGNAILRPGQRGTVAEQAQNVATTAAQVVEILKAGYDVVITHGNGPQVGNILIQQEAGSELVPPMTLDICGAQSQGQIGYMIQQSLGGLLAQAGMSRPVVTVLTQVQVNPDDPAFSRPTKPVGPFYTEERARRRMAQTGETWVEDAGRGWRKVVASPDPVAIVEAATIRELSQGGTVVIASGGGGIPVVETAPGIFRGVEAVIDKDLAGQRLATGLGASAFVILTDVSRVCLEYKTARQRELASMSLEEAGAYMAQGHFKPGSMGPKVKAAMRFVEAGGQAAIITSLDAAVDAITGDAGTWISRNGRRECNLRESQSGL